MCALVMLGLLGAISLLLSGMPWPASIPLALLAAGQGMWAARREWTRSPVWLVIPASGQATLGGHPLHDWDLQWRGPMAFLRFRGQDGRRQHLSWWPDTLPPAARRELRLAVPVQGPARSPASMAS
ncbi:hypothetical protein QLQ15_14840 [Lysobacter sp. LF1]|uniref:Toxin CptA n=2 Tax=Lysobacter stagni TaxID=3045172 RepID=A0ABT6XJD8_9GAMM|nr:hypothetical protein [Lysobacter sp. LF1]MDI9240184.1 hypothetical protein [Lysobacter sp. LF1]